MKTIVLMRHAQAQNEPTAERDFDRILTAEGRTMATESAVRLQQQDIQIDQILTSSALRTLQTAQLIAQASSPDAGFLALEDLYLAEPSAYIQAMRKHTVNTSQTLLIVGHNPGIAQLICSWARDHIAIPPATIAVFDFHQNDWSHLTPAAGTDCSLRLLIQHGNVCAERPDS